MDEYNAASMTSSNRFEKNNFQIRQKVLSIGNKYFMEDGKGNLVGFCKQKVLKMKEDIRIYADKNKTQEMFRIKQENILDFSGSFKVVDSQLEQTIGYLQRKGIKSMMRDEWLILDKNKKQIGRVEEDSMLMAILRRFVSNIIPYKYTIYHNGREIGNFNEKFTFVKDIYNLEIDNDPNFNLDRRLLLSISICLDAIEGE